LVKCYSRPRKSIRWEDQQEHWVEARIDDGVYAMRNKNVNLPIKIRDDDGRMIISSLEVYNAKVEGVLAGRDWREMEEEENMTKNKGHLEEFLFKRNWPLVEKCGGKSIREYIKNA
jgi:hypothetical protein